MLPFHAMLKLAGAAILLATLAGVMVAGVETVPQWAQYVMWTGVGCTFAGLLVEPATPTPATGAEEAPHE